MTTDRRRLGRTGLLGSFEELVLLALLHQDRQAYAVSIRRELAERLGTEVTMGAVYATLDRLEGKGLVSERDEAPETGRRGRPRTYFDILPDGLAALNQTRRARDAMWHGIRLPASAARRTIS